MELELKTISLTIALGLLSAAVTWFTVTLARGERFLLSVWRKLSPDDAGETEHLPATAYLGVPAVAAFALAISFGITLEDLSKNALGRHSPTFLDVPLHLFLPLEESSRLSVLFKASKKSDPRADEKNGPAPAMQEDNPDQQLPARIGCETLGGTWDEKEDLPDTNGIGLSEQGQQVYETLKDITEDPRVSHIFEIATPLEERTWGSLTALVSLHPASDQTKKDATCKKLHDIYPLYYVAKNYIYESRIQFDELEAIRHRIDFVRSLIYLATLSVIALCIALCWRVARHGQDMEIDTPPNPNPILNAERRLISQSFKFCNKVKLFQYRAVFLLVGTGLLFVPKLSVWLVAVTILIGLLAWRVLVVLKVATPEVGPNLSLTQTLIYYLCALTAVTLISISIYVSEETGYANRVFGYYATYRSLEAHGHEAREKLREERAKD
jgi:hypothetical protein